MECGRFSFHFARHPFSRSNGVSFIPPKSDDNSSAHKRAGMLFFVFCSLWVGR